MTNTTRRELWSQLVARAATPKAGSLPSRNILLVVFMRGAVDGLNVVVPHGSSDYYRLRPLVKVAEPSEDDGALDLDGFFGLNPGLSALLPYWNSGQMAAIHAAGSPHDSRSHFDAQTIMETGVQDPNATLTGWLGRHVAATHSGGQASPFRCVAIAGSAPRSLQGPVAPLALSSFNTFNAILNQGDDFMQAITALHSADTALAMQSRLASDVLQVLKSSDPAALEPANGAEYPANAFARNLQKAAQLIRAELGCEFLSVDIGGWDTHVNQNNALRNNLATLGNALHAFMTDLGPEIMRRVTIVTMSEFGRRARENGSLGTDHGHGNVMLTLGAGVNGGRVYSKWPGLADDDLDRGDLQVTTDYRSVLSELLQARTASPHLEATFPAFTAPRNQGIFRA